MKPQATTTRINAIDSRASIPPAHPFAGAEAANRASQPPPPEPCTGELLNTLESAAAHLARRTDSLLGQMVGRPSDEGSASSPTPMGFNPRLFHLCTQLNAAHDNISRMAQYLGVEL